MANWKIEIVQPQSLKVFCISVSNIVYVLLYLLMDTLEYSETTAKHTQMCSLMHELSQLCKELVLICDTYFSTALLAVTETSVITNPH